MFLRQLSILLGLCLASILGACSDNNEPKEPIQPPPPTQAELDAFIQKVTGDLIFVEGGSYTMGIDPSSFQKGSAWQKHFSQFNAFHVHASAMYPHKVTLDSFSISKYEVSWYEFDMYSRMMGLPLKGAQKREHSPSRYIPTRSAFYVSWYDAKNYCQWLGDLTELPFDLPTEAQWEYAARARGLDIPFATHNGNYTRKDSDIPITEMHKHTPNPLGIYHMNGYQEEWVNDWLSSTYYDESPENNPQGPETGDKKVIRGASNGMSSRGFRNNYNRSGLRPTSTAGIDTAFRCIAIIENPTH